MPSKTITMRPPEGYDTFPSSSSRGSSNDSWNHHSSKYQPNSSYSARSVSTGTPTSLVSSQATSSSYHHKGYYHYNDEEDLPFDQQPNYLQDMAPSFDEGTDEATSDPATEEFSEAPPNDDSMDRYYDQAETDASLAVSTGAPTMDDVAQQRQQPEPSHTNMDSHEEMVHHYHHHKSTPAGKGLLGGGMENAAPQEELIHHAPPPHSSPKNNMWIEPDQEEWRRSQEEELHYHNESFEDYGFTHATQSPPPPDDLEYHSESYEQTYEQSYEHYDGAESSKVSSLTGGTHLPAADQTKPRSILKRPNVEGSDAEESIPSKKSPKSWFKSKQERRRHKHRVDDTDDTSLELYKGGAPRERPSSVSRRTQEAFGKREKQRGKSPTNEESSRGVSFDKRHRVHRYEQEEDSETQYTGWTGTSSVNSTYSKSMESEVEDLVKDLLFLGEPETTKPGRRRGSSSNNRRGDLVADSRADTSFEDTTIGESTLDTADEDVTLNTLEDTVSAYDESTYGGTFESKTTRSSDMTEDPLVSMWHAVTGGFEAMLGLDPQEEKAGKKKKSKPPSIPRVQSPQDSRSLTPQSAMATADFQHDEDLDNSQSSTLADMIDMASEFLLGTDSKPKPESDSKSYRSLEDDGRLAELAMYAARSKHEIHGIVYDETKDVDIVTEVKFSVVRVLLPMGILFQENKGGCWVTKVFAAGNAALRAKGGTVEVGDQLAAINGTSAIELKVDKVCNLVSQVPKGKEVELTFLRYTGPMRPSPGTVREEGYEVRDAGMESSRRMFGSSRQRKNNWMSSRRKIKVEPPPQYQPPPKENKKRFRLFGRKKASM